MLTDRQEVGPRLPSEKTLFEWSKLVDKYKGQNVATAPHTRHILDIEQRGIVAYDRDTGEVVEFVETDTR